MSLGQPVAEFGQTCPKCGAVQESPGSTFCEECGTDLRLASVAKPPPQPQPHPRSLPPVLQPKQLSRLWHVLGMPFRLLKRGIETLLSLIFSILALIWRVISFTLRTAAVLLVIGSLIVGLSYVPEVRASVPVMKEVPAIAKQMLRRAESVGGKLLARVSSLTTQRQPQARTSAPRRTSQQARPTQQPRTPTSQRTSQAQRSPSKPAVSTQKAAPARAAVLLLFYVKSTPSGATVQLDARQVGKTPITLKVAPGIHKVTISRPGYASVTRTVTVKAGKAASLNVKLVARRTPKPTAPTPKPPAESPREP